MNAGLTKLLVEAAPLLYREMRYFACGDGWFPLLLDLSRKLEPMIAAEAGEHKPAASQVKEKYATLRFYTTSETAAMAQAITEAERRSVVTCEQCGAPGKLRGGSWLKTACDEHAAPIR